MERDVPTALKSVLRTSRSTYERPVMVRSSKTRNPKLSFAPQAKSSRSVAPRFPGAAKGLGFEGEMLPVLA